MDTQKNILAAFIIMALVTSGAYALFHYRSASARIAQVSSPVSQNPVQKAAAVQEKNRVVTSSDGSKSLTMKVNNGANNAATYSFYVQGANTALFEKSVGSGTSMDIPDNAWAPGENYIFLEQSTNGAKDYFVLKPNGEVFASGQKALDVGAVFAAKYTDYEFNGATGWADPSLLIVESTNKDGSTGPSFWYEMPEGSFILLSQHQ
ncbi:MAG: hypothetical protein ACHQT7_03125 [Candidatus Levyibacteriota bacterium]